MEGFSLPLCLLEWVDGEAMNCAIQSSASGQPVKCALLCTAGKKKKESKKKKEGEEKKLSPLCVERTQQESEFAITSACRRSKLGSSDLHTLAHWTVSLFSLLIACVYGLRLDALRDPTAMQGFYP